MAEAEIVKNLKIQNNSSIGVPNSAVMSMKELREYVTKYVDVNELRISRGKMVRLDPVLHKCIYGKGNADIEECTWEKLYGGVQSKTNPAYSIQFPGQGQPHIKKVNVFLKFII